MVFLVLSAASALLLATLAAVLWVRRPPAPLWPVVFVCQVLALLWVIGDLWATNASSVAEKQVALLLLFSGSIPIAPAWWETTRRYVRIHGLSRPWLESRWAQLPLWFGGAMWLMAMTNAWHGQFITPVIDGRNHYQWGIEAAFYGSYAIGAAAAALSGWAALHHPSPVMRRKFMLLMAATLAPAAANLLHLRLPGWPREDTTAIGLGLASLIALYGILRVRLFSPMPASLLQVLRRVSVGLLMLDRGGRLVAWNPAAERLLGGMELQPDLRLLRELARVLKNGDDRGRLRSSRQLTDLLTGATEPGKSHVFRYAGTGEDRWLELAVVPVPAARGGLTAVCLTITDVSEQRHAERERQELALHMRDLDKLQSLGRMAGGVAHDFNNLLTSIVGNTQLALEELPPGAELREYLTEIRGSARTAAELTDQLLAYSGRSEMMTEATSLTGLVREMEPLMKSSMPGNVEFRSQLAEEIPRVDGDPNQLRQVIMNLIANAGEAIGADEGYVTIRTRGISADPRLLASNGLRDELEPGLHALLEVHDSGRGMDEATRRRVFEPFFTTHSRGRGLGLAAVFGIVRAHRGAITVASEPGSGSTFRVWLPARSSAAKTASASPPAVAPMQLGDATILVVDDQQAVRRVARRVLTRAGFAIYGAASAQQALEIFREQHHEIDLVLLDLTMPGLGGEEALHRIKEIDPEARVVLMSGFDETDAMKRLDGAKLGGFLHKPWEPAELLSAVHRALGVREAGRG